LVPDPIAVDQVVTGIQGTDHALEIDRHVVGVVIREADVFFLAGDGFAVFDGLSPIADILHTFGDDAGVVSMRKRFMCRPL
jgi:hypothetical protein